MRRLPLMLQLTVILFCVLAIPTAILTWYIGAQIWRDSELAIAESTQAELNSNLQLTENALNNLYKNTVTIAGDKTFESIRSYKTYDKLSSNYNHAINGQAIQRELSKLNHMVEGIYSTFFYQTDSDYVISTDKGITRLERYDSIDWIEDVLVDQRGISGVLYPRKLSSGVNVISYVLPLNRLATNTSGTIVVNLRESQIEDYFVSSDPAKKGYWLMNSNGTIMSHGDKKLLRENGNEDPIIDEILKGGLLEGYAFHQIDGKRMLYTWAHTKGENWISVSKYSVDEMMTGAHTLLRNIILITTFIILVGIVVTVILATWLSKPAKRLVRQLRSRTNFRGNVRNELTILDEAFKEMQKEERVLHKLLDTRERDSHRLAIHNLVRGEVTPEINELFPASHFLVAIVSIDNYEAYVDKHNAETRSLHYQSFTKKCDDYSLKDLIIRSVYQGEGYFVIVFNYWQRDDEVIPLEIHDTILEVQGKAKELLDHSVTIGVSDPTDGLEKVSDCVIEAMAVIKHRMVEESGGITYWNEKDRIEKKYTYPIHSERRILNYLGLGDLKNILKELDMISSEIRTTEFISYDNILFIYHQLVSIGVKYLTENNVNEAQIFEKWGNIYTTIASTDTLEELEKYMRDFFTEIVHYIKRTTRSNRGYDERILNYLDEHYCEEIDFQEMAEDIGISYSYMRRIINDTTGMSLIDHLNLRRIEKAKRMLVETDLTITKIASKVGYQNVQSLNRYFRKFDGMAPSNYRAMKS